MLRYLGDLEKRTISDAFASDLAGYYENASEAQISLLKDAQENVKAGFSLCLKDRYEEARIKFQAARILFEKAGNYIEAETICDHFIAYCHYNTDQYKLAYELLTRVNEFCEKKNYRWFRLMNLDFLLGGREKLEYQSFTEIETDYEKGLAQAEEIKDNFMIQKFLLALIRKNQFVGQEEHTFNYLHKVLQFSKEPNVSERQKFRVFDKAIPILAMSRFQNFAREVALESIACTESMKTPLFFISSQINAGIVEVQAGNLDTGEVWFKAALVETGRLEKESKAPYVAKIYNQMAQLEKKRGDLVKAGELYDRSLEIQKKLNTPVFLYETKKSRLLVHQQLGNDNEVEKDIYSTLKLAENYREQINDEQKRNSFFDNEQDIYDIAIEHKLRMNQSKAAYDYAELSNSRSLLDLLGQSANVSVQNKDVRVILNRSYKKPAGLREIMRAMPESAQILQYSILKDKVLIWALTSKSFAVVSSPVSSEELKKNVESYLISIREKNPDEYLSRKLYDQLILPALQLIDKDKEICLIPDKILFRLPFSSLKSPENRYVVQDATISYSPSANIFINLTRNAVARMHAENEGILSIGNPSFDTAQFPKLRLLPDAEKEASDVAKNYTYSKVITGKDATKQAFRENYPEFEIIHFAGHYIAEPERPLLSKLVLASDPETGGPGILTNAEMITEKLPKAKLIVLSACQTGVERYSNGEGLLGLSRTLLSVQVPLVVASQWEADSAATAKLMTAFHYFRRQRNLSTTNALRQAQLEMLNGDNERFRSPYFWAQFAVYGGHAAY